MGIDKIHILVQPDVRPDPAIQVRVANEQILINAHRRGKHPWGEMRRDCPLCQLGK